MKRWLPIAITPILLLGLSGDPEVGPPAGASLATAGPRADPAAGSADAVRVALVKMPYSGSRNVAELSPTPDYLEAGGIAEILKGRGYDLAPIATARLDPDEEGEYGEWNRLGLANAHLARIVAERTRAGYVSVGLQANCNALMGMLGGMPVAVSSGLALHRLRTKSGLDPALPTSYIVMAAVRDTDPLEQEIIDRSDVEMLSTEDIRQVSERVHEQMKRLSSLTDVVYVHIDMDVLDPAEVEGHSLTVPDGPTSTELAAALTAMFRYEKVAALGIASTPSGDRDPEGLSRQAAYNLILGALDGVAQR